VRQFALGRFLGYVQVRYDDNEVVHEPLYSSETILAWNIAGRAPRTREFLHGHEIHT
jgi:hypothetical protein